MTLVLVEAVAKVECADKLKDLFKPALPDTRAHDGCQDVTVFLDEDRNTFVIAAARSWQAFRDDPEWQTMRPESLADGPIVTNVKVTFMSPAYFPPTR